MLIHREKDAWEITVPAKVNLFLEVIGRRSDGYHELDTVMLGVSLCDRLRFRATEHEELRMDIFPTAEDEFAKLSSDDNAWEIPCDGTNLVIRALEATRQRLGIAAGMQVELIKGIPAQAGLGGGSADAAAAITGGMLAWIGEFRPNEANELASGLGSDINFFIEGRGTEAGSGNWLARCVGRGELVIPISSNWELDMVVIHPPQGCSTKNVFRRLSESNLSETDSAIASDLVRAIEQQDRSLLANELFNRLEKPAKAENPWIGLIMERLADEPWVLGSCLSGSGSAIVAMVENAEQSAQLSARLKEEINVRAYAVNSWQTPTIGEQLTAMNG